MRGEEVTGCIKEQREELNNCCSSSKYFQGHHIEEDITGGTYIMREENEKCIQNFSLEIEWKRALAMYAKNNIKINIK